MSIFELLSKTDFDKVMDKVYSDGKSKAYCPIRFFTEEQIEELTTKKNE